MSIRMVVVLFLNFYTTRVLLSNLGVEDYGVYNVVAGFVTMFSFLSTSMSNGIQRFFNFEYGKNGSSGANKVFNTAVIIQLILAVIIVCISEFIGIWYIREKMVIPSTRVFAAHWVFQFSLISFICTILQVPFVAAVMAHENLNFYALISVVDAILKLLVVFLLQLLGADRLIMYGFLVSMISVINLFIYAVYAREHYLEIRFRKTFDKDLFLSMLGFSGWNCFGSFAGVMKEQGINLVLNFFCGPIVNAARGVASQINGGLQSFVQNISVPIRPQVVKSYAIGNFKHCLNLTFSLSKLSCCIIYLLSLPIVLEIDYILDVWLKGNIPEHTSSFVFIVILVSYINNLNSAVSGIVHASGKMRNYQVVTSIISLLCIPGAYIALLIGSSPEVALLMVFIFAMLSQMAALFILRTIIDFKLSDYFKHVLWPFLELVLMTVLLPLVPRYLMPQSFLRLVIVAGVSFIASLLVIYLKVLTDAEKEIINQLAFKLKRK